MTPTLSFVSICTVVLQCHKKSLIQPLYDFSINIEHTGLRREIESVLSSACNYVTEDRISIQCGFLACRRKACVDDI